MEPHLAAILAADMIGYSRLLGEYEASALGPLKHLTVGFYFGPHFGRCKARSPGLRQ